MNSASYNCLNVSDSGKSMISRKEKPGNKRGIKKILVIASLIFSGAGNLAFCQGQVYDSFEGSKAINYGARNGVLDTATKNPLSDKVNYSAKCAKYTRSGEKKFDNIKMNLKGKLTGVSAYATYLGIPPKIKLKVYTTAPVGTLVEVLLGSKGRNNEYPEGTHSQYQAHTTVSGQWEELEFKFSQIPEGSETSEEQINQVTLMFYPNSANMDTYYFDDLTGPGVVKSETAQAPADNDVKKEKVNTPKNEKTNTIKKKPAPKSEKPMGTR